MSFRSNLTATESRIALAEFQEQIRAAAGSAFLFAFLGHGAGGDGRQLLFCKDAAAAGVGGGGAGFLRFDQVRRRLAAARHDVKRTAAVFIIDCCRDGTLDAVGSGGGPTAATTAAAAASSLYNSYTVYSTVPGAAAGDGEPGLGGPFVSRLCREARGGGPLDKALRRVRMHMGEEGQQPPAEDMLIKELLLSVRVGRAWIQTRPYEKHTGLNPCSPGLKSKAAPNAPRAAWLTTPPQWQDFCFELGFR